MRTPVLLSISRDRNSQSEGCRNSFSDLLFNNCMIWKGNRIVNCIFCKSSEILWKSSKNKAKSLELTRKVPIFGTSIRGIRRKDDNLYGSLSRFEPQLYEPSLFGVDGFVLYWFLRNCYAILYQVLVGTLEPNCQFDILVLHNQQLLKRLLITGLSLGWEFSYQCRILENLR